MARNCTISGSISPQDNLHLEAVISHMKTKTTISKFINHAVQIALRLGPERFEEFMASDAYEIGDAIIDFLNESSGRTCNRQF